MTENTRAAAVMRALSTPPAPLPAVTAEVAASHQAEAKPRAPRRTDLKHIGGYFDPDDVEKFAFLRARYGLDNSKLMRLAIEELYAKHQTRRALGGT